MFPPEWDEGCKHCPFWADHYDAAGVHLNHRDVTFVAVSRAPLAKIEAFKRRMGWRFQWVSSGNTDFNYDYHVSFTPDEVKRGAMFYNYAHGDAEIGRAHVCHSQISYAVFCLKKKKKKRRKQMHTVTRVVL